MPTYEYKCSACGHQFEKFQSMSAAPVRRCPKCHKNQVRRLIGTGAGLIFRGSGFYITDYRDASYAEKAKADSSEGKPAEKSDAKPDTKSDAKSDTKPDASRKADKPVKKPESKVAKKK